MIVYLIGIVLVGILGALRLGFSYRKEIEDATICHPWEHELFFLN